MAELTASAQPDPAVSLRSRRMSDATRWWCAVAMGCALSVPFGILLSYVAFLMVFLGLFFYALFGLLIGAAVCRAASPNTHLPKISVIAGTTLMVLIGWGVSLKWEIDGLPHDVARQAIEARKHLPEGMSREQYMREVENQVREVLASRYPPGGAIGYVRWVMDSGRFAKGTLEGVTREVSRPQRRWIWAIRTFLSVLLLAFGVASMTWTLTSPARRPAPPSPSKLYG